jgi:hypothetical protein
MNELLNSSGEIRGRLVKDYVIGLQTICAVKSNKLKLMEVVRNCGSSAGPYELNVTPRVGCCMRAVLQLELSRSGLCVYTKSQVHVSMCCTCGNGSGRDDDYVVVVVCYCCCCCCFLLFVVGAAAAAVVMVM